MSEISLVLVILVLIILFAKYKQRPIVSKCNQHRAYFDKMYYNVPSLHLLPQQTYEYKPDSMNDLSNVEHQLKEKLSNTDSVSAKWSSEIDGTKNSSNGSVIYDNMDVSIDPIYLQKHLGNTITEDSSRARYNIMTEPFADDAMYDPDFSYNNKYMNPTKVQGNDRYAILYDDEHKKMREKKWGNKDYTDYSEIYNENSMKRKDGSSLIYDDEFPSIPTKKIQAILDERKRKESVKNN